MFEKGNTIGFKKGKIPWNKGKSYHSKHRGKPLSEAHKQALKVPHEGNGGKWKRTEKHREHSRKIMEDFYKNGGVRGFKAKPYFLKGEANNNWKGGITPLNEKIRKSVKYKKWQLAIFIRDNFTCCLCGKRGGEMHADHIKMFAFHEDLRFELTNGRTLCLKCHRKTDTFGGKEHKCCYAKPT